MRNEMLLKIRQVGYGKKIPLECNRLITGVDRG